jgi:hypothetical protein
MPDDWPRPDWNPAEWGPAGSVLNALLIAWDQLRTGQIEPVALKANALVRILDRLYPNLGLGRLQRESGDQARLDKIAAGLAAAGAHRNPRVIEASLALAHAVRGHLQLKIVNPAHLHHLFEIDSLDVAPTDRPSFDIPFHFMLGAQTKRLIGSVDFDEPVGRTVETQRFTDLTLYNTHLYPGDDTEPALRLPEAAPLRPGARYTLEVAIRGDRTGIGAHIPAFRAVVDPRRNRETMGIFAVAEVLTGPIDIDESIAALSWPFQEDSTAAFFRFTVQDKLPAALVEATIEIRLYHANLDLLDVVHLQMSAATRSVADCPPHAVQWPGPASGTPRLDPDDAIRGLTIRVRPGEQGYRLEFIFQRNETEITIPIKRHISTGDLENLLAWVRDFWTKLAITTYANKLTVLTSTWTAHLAELRDLGTEAWYRLFGSRTAGQMGGTETLGLWLSQMELTEGLHIQITYDSKLTDFVFPWTILYPPSGLEKPVDPLRFWGARYRIEQVWGGAQREQLQNEPVGVTVAVDPSFGETASELTMFDGFGAAAAGRINIGDPIVSGPALIRALSQAPSHHLYYFFCHGYAPAGPALARRDGIQRLRERLEQLAEAERKPWDTLLALTARMGDQPWILLGDGQITETALIPERFFSGRRPILFLNMCHSAALSPTMTSGLIRLFLDKDASAVLGTESPMTSIFAHAFAAQVLSHMFGGCDVGTSLWRARRHFLADTVRNPLGLAYTLYGRATARLGAGPLINNPEPELEKARD